MHDEDHNSSSNVLFNDERGDQGDADQHTNVHVLAQQPFYRPKNDRDSPHQGRQQDQIEAEDLAHQTCCPQDYEQPNGARQEELPISKIYTLYS